MNDFTMIINDQPRLWIIWFSAWSFSLKNPPSLNRARHAMHFKIDANLTPECHTRPPARRWSCWRHPHQTHGSHLHVALQSCIQIGWRVNLADFDGLTWPINWYSKRFQLSNISKKHTNIWSELLGGWISSIRVPFFWQNGDLFRYCHHFWTSCNFAWLILSLWRFVRGCKINP